MVTTVNLTTTCTVSYVTKAEKTDDCPVAQQLTDYLDSSSVGVESMKHFHAVENAFVKAISTLPSSAAVERLFNAAGQILCVHYCTVSDKHLDMMVF